MEFPAPLNLPNSQLYLTITWQLPLTRPVPLKMEIIFGEISVDRVWASIR